MVCVDREAVEGREALEGREVREAVVEEPFCLRSAAAQNEITSNNDNCGRFYTVLIRLSTD